MIDNASDLLSSARLADPMLQLFEPDGRPRATVPLNIGGWRCAIAARAGEVAVLDESVREFVLVAADGAYTGRARLPEGLQPRDRSLGPITYSPDGRELWLVGHDLVLYRFETASSCAGPPCGESRWSRWSGEPGRAWLVHEEHQRTLLASAAGARLKTVPRP